MPRASALSGSLLFAALLPVAASICTSAIFGSAATAATGTVQGRVFNPVSREYVGNAEVRLEGTNRVVFTENDGTFSFPGVAADFKATRRLVRSLNAVYTYVEGEFWNRNFNFVAANSNANNGRGTVGGDGLLTLSTRRTAQNTVPALSNAGGTATLENYTRTVSPKFEYKIDSLLFDGGFNYSRAVNAYVSLERGFS